MYPQYFFILHFNFTFQVYIVCTELFAHWFLICSCLAGFHCYVTLVLIKKNKQTMLYICLVCLSSFHVFHRIYLYMKLCKKNNSFQVCQCLFHHHYLQQVSAVSCYFQLASSRFPLWPEVGVLSQLLTLSLHLSYPRV